MTIKKINNANQMTFTLTGRLDAVTSPQFEAELIPECENAKTIILDFKDVDYVSSAGLRVLLAGEKKSKSNGGKMFLTNVSDEVMEVLELTGFSNILNIIAN